MGEWIGVRFFGNLFAPHSDSFTMSPGFKLRQISISFGISLFLIPMKPFLLPNPDNYYSSCGRVSWLYMDLETPAHMARITLTWHHNVILHKQLALTSSYRFQLCLSVHYCTHGLPNAWLLVDCVCINYMYITTFSRVQWRKIIIPLLTLGYDLCLIFMVKWSQPGRNNYVCFDNRVPWSYRYQICISNTLWFDLLMSKSSTFTRH